MLDALFRGISFLLRLAVTLAGVVLGGLMLLFGVVLAIGLIGWALLRGRRPQFRAFRNGRFGGAPSPRPRGPAEVIDVDARVVPDDDRRPHAYVHATDRKAG